MPKLKWEDAARADIKEIADYISDDNIEAALALVNEIDFKGKQLPYHPRLYRRGRVSGTREMVVRRNYIVIYTETPELVTILRVIHAARQWP